MHHQLVPAFLDTGQAGVDFRGQLPGTAALPFGGKAKALAGEIFVGAHDRAPEIAS
jgi:hypothetical protein